MLKRLIDWIMNFVAASALMGRRLRYLIYRLCGCNIKTKRISPGCIFSSNKIIIGEKTFINYRCIFDNEELIVIGDHCHIAHEVILAGATHPLGSPNCRAGKVYGLPIIIGNGCWIGARVTVLPGITIGNGVVIAAGSVVTKDCEPNCLYAGVPARKIRELDC